MYCPNCGYEYQDWATVCTDCGSSLLRGSPPHPPTPLPDDGRFDKWTILTNVPNAFMGNVLKDQLEQAGVPVLLKRMTSTDIAQWSHNDFVAHDLYVPLGFVPQAREILAGTPAGDATDSSLPEYIEDYGIPVAEEPTYSLRDGGYEEYHSGLPSWSRSRVYRILMGLLLLTWTLPLLWNMIKAFVEGLGRLFR